VITTNLPPILHRFQRTWTHVHVRSRSSVCRLSVTFVRPILRRLKFSAIFLRHGTLAISKLSIKILRRSSQGNPFVGGVKHNRGSRILRLWTYRTLYPGNGARLKAKLVLITIFVKFYLDVNGWPWYPSGIETIPKISTGWVGRTNVTVDRQTGRRQTDGR